MKFQSEYNITIKQFEDFILIVYVIVDDSYLITILGDKGYVGEEVFEDMQKHIYA